VDPARPPGAGKLGALLAASAEVDAASKQVDEQAAPGTVVALAKTTPEPAGMSPTVD
jgi:hypothetical protein